MKRNDINELKTKTVDELRRLLIDSRESLLKIKNEESIGKVSAKGESMAGIKNPNQAKKIKKDIARIMTFLSMKQVEKKEVQTR